MKRTICLSLSAAVSLLAAATLACAPAMAQDVKAGRAKASVQCAVCHGQAGIAELPTAANLAGQQEIYLAKALEDFRSGKRVNEMMTVVSKGLSDADIADLAAWYASIKITVETP
ncbi:cytochrome c [Ancylobacter dichloromethanicus]|uniref:Cytochrome c554 n=1 Tax=Ancylobacter dichloromethanicus TaxID=518825 RepID=A0A9W6JE94_9HYPH|nr:cytochrome c [Ancylobacter dichloromethanicus]MBS7552483.1 cytochrome c [Ancylobacter dichloromethanicus]GLK74225.1 cytochrome c554 [Ancylobacter dichloromethanicus]